MSILVKNGWIITHDQGNNVIKNGGLYIENDKIIEVGTTSDLESKYSSSDEIIDAAGRVVMPGFICSHMHFYSAFATGMPLDPFPPGFHNVLKHLWWKLDKALTKDDVYFSALLGYIQAVRSGTTSVIDHHASPSYISGSLDQIEKAGRELGVRSNLCYEVTDRNGKEGAEKGLNENQRYLKKISNSKDDLFSGLVGLHASFTLRDDSLNQAKEIMDEFQTGIHVHVAEGTVDGEDADKKYRSTPIQRLDRFGLLNDKSVVAHCIHLEETDYPIIKERNVNVAHQPRSNMNNAVGCINLEKMEEYGISVGMGTDGMSSDMKPEVMVGSLLQKHQRQDNTIGMMEAYNALIHQNPIIYEKITGLKLGKLMPNYKADIVISSYRPKTPLNSDNVAGHVMFGIINEPVNTTIIEGHLRMSENNILGIDERSINDKSMELAQAVWDRID